MIDLFGKGSFLRTWLPLLLLAILVAALFPPCHPRRSDDLRAPWEGVVLLISVDPPPAEPLRLVASLPLAAASGAALERLVVGDLAIDAGGSGGARPLLLRSPLGALGARLVRRVPPRARGAEGIAITLALHRAADLEVAGDSAIGALLREGEITAAGGTRPLLAPIVELPLEITLDPSRERRWPGRAERFAEEWARLRDETPGGLTPYIHARVTLPGAAQGTAPGAAPDPSPGPSPGVTPRSER